MQFTDENESRKRRQISTRMGENGTLCLESFVEKGGYIMATSSITKKFVIKDDETMKRLVNALEAPKKQRTEKKSYEKGKELLLQHYGR